MSKKNLLVTFLLVLAIISGCQKSNPRHPQPSITVETTKPSTPTLPAKVEDDWSLDIFRQGLITTQQAGLEQHTGASIYHIDLEISADYTEVKGQQEVRYTNLEDIPLNEIYFRLFANSLGGRIQISKVLLNGQPVQSVLEAKETALRLPLEEALSPGQSVTISMDFRVTIPTEFGGNYGLLSYIDNILALDSIYPVIPAYDEKGWQKDYPPSNGDLTYNDASFYLVNLTAPSALVIASSGTTIQRSEENGLQRLTIICAPARDFYIATSPDLIQISEEAGETRVNSYAFKSGEEFARIALTTAVNALESFNSRLEPYPYLEYDIVSTPMLALGIEYPGIVGISTQLYDKSTSVWGLPASVLIESVVAHETAHQWFYNLVGNDQWNEPWLDEALAQYATNLYYLDTYGASAAEAFRSSWSDTWKRIDQVEIPIGLPAGDYQANEYSPIVYNRGPLFLMALAEQMGQKTFDEFLKKYTLSNEWEIATAEEFRQMAEAQCKCDLGGLFNQWVVPQK
jgi:hypothetical protein